MNGAIQSGIRAAGEVADVLGITPARDAQIARRKKLKSQAAVFARSAARAAKTASGKRNMMKIERPPKKERSHPGARGAKKKRRGRRV